MRKLLWAVAIGSLVAPALAQDPAARKLGDKQKTWNPANFRTGLSDCSIAPIRDGYALSGRAQVSFGKEDGAGLDLAVGASDGAAPTVTAHAINTKGTGATNHRAMEKSCGLGSSGETADRRAPGAVASCSVSGDPDAPSLRFTIPLALFDGRGTAKNYVGHVTLMKREAGAPAQPIYFSKKGYDNWKAHSDMGAANKAAADTELKVVATCDTSGLARGKGKPTKGNYDLAMGTKA